MREKNYYDILEIPFHSSQDEIYQGYLRAKNAYSQDSLALYSLISEEECQELLGLIEEAYSILSEPLKRKEYDRARGLNIEFNYHNPLPSTPGHGLEKEIHQIKQEADSTGSSMTKIVAKKRFSLDYKENPQFEKEIEQTSDFTGEFLKKVREYKQVDLPRLADMTKVSKTYLGHIEQEAFDKLPAPVYVRGFVFQYAKCLKLNPELVANSYIFRMKKAIP